MANHDASQQALGYIYQSQCALYLLLDSEDPDVNVCIEKFDDISFHKEQDPYLQLQVKYHSSNGEITNTSTDFWRTIKAWIDNIQVNPNLLQNTVFCIITTNTIAKDSIIEKIQNKTDSIDNIYSMLVTIAQNGKSNCDSTSSIIYKRYDSFLNVHPDIIKKLIQSIKIQPDFPNPTSINYKIFNKLQLFTSKQTIQIVYDRLLGWWYRKIVECLSSIEPVLISFDELRREICNITSELRDDNLPIDVTDKEVECIEKSEDVNILTKQLKIINSRQARINNALKNYYKTYAQRSKWLRESLVLSLIHI